MTAHSKPNVLVTAVGGPPGLNALRALFETDRYQLVAADADAHAAGLYQYTDNHVVLPPASDPEKYLAGLAAAIEQHEIDVVLPCIEDEVLFAARNHPQIEALGAAVLVPDSQVLDRAVDKWAATQACIEIGVPCPHSICIKTATDRDVAAEALELLAQVCPPPWIAKPCVGYGMRDVQRVETLQAALNVVAGQTNDFIVQEFLPAPVGNMHMAGLLYDRDGRVTRRFTSRSTRTLFADGGPATAGISIDSPELTEQTEAVLAHIGGWSGPVMVEWLFDPGHGQFMLLDINPRPWGYGYLAVAAGINFPADAVELALGKDIGPDNGFRVGVSMVRTTFDLTFDASPYPIKDVKHAKD
jgi:carbamoyl-phosphate synthase large subunit